MMRRGGGSDSRSVRHRMARLRSRFQKIHFHFGVVSSAVEQPLNRGEAFGERPAPLREPIRWRIGLERQPRRVFPGPAAVLGMDAFAGLPSPSDFSLGNRPAVSIERADPQAHDKVVSLIAQLLKGVAARLPSSAELDLDASSIDEPIRLSVGPTAPQRALWPPANPPRAFPRSCRAVWKGAV